MKRKSRKNNPQNIEKENRENSSEQLSAGDTAKTSSHIEIDEIVPEKSPVETHSEAKENVSGENNSENTGENGYFLQEKSTFISKWIKPHLAFIFILIVQTLIILAFSAPLEETEKFIIGGLSYFNPPPSGENLVVVVDINDDDRREIFQGKNDPLDPPKLYQIIQAIAAQKPKVIGIDIATSHEEFKELDLQPTNVPFVWAETPVIIDGKILGKLSPLGGSELPEGHYEAIPASPKDSDNTQRFYQRILPAGEGRTEISFPAKIARLAVPNVLNFKDDDTELRYIKFVNNRQEEFRPHISAGEILAQNQENSDKINLENKIVLLGGSFSGQDRTETPAGQMLGVDVQATIIETELAGGGRTPLNDFLKFIFVLLTSIGLLLIFHWNSILPATLWSLLICVIIAAFVSIIFQDLVGGVILFGAFLLSLFSQVYEKFRDIKKDKLPKLRNSAVD